MVEPETEAPTDDDRVKKKGKKKVKRAKASSTALLLEDRLAAFGEAFMSSIEGSDASRNGGASGLKRPRNSAGPKASSKPASCNEEALGAGSRKKRRKRGACASESQAGKGPERPGTETTVEEAQTQAPADGRGGQPGSRENVMVGVEKPRHVVSAAERRRFMSGKVSEIRSKATQGHTATSSSAKSQQEAEFNKTLREVLQFVTPHLGKQERRQWEEAKILALGGTIEKRQKTPYGVLQRDRKRARATRTEAEAEKKQTGFITSNDRFAVLAWEKDNIMKKRKQQVKEKHKKRDAFNLLRLGMGARERKGLVTIPKTQLRRRMGRGLQP